MTNIKLKTNVMFIIFVFSFAFTCSCDNKVQHQYYDAVINGARLYYHFITVDSTKPYVFFLHGGPGGNSQQVEQLFPYLTEEKVNWVFMDQRGSGRSAVYHSDPVKSELTLDQLTPELMVEDIEAIRQKHNLGKIIVYGHSWGGNLATYYVYRYPESLLGYIIASCSHNWQENNNTIIDYYLKYIPETTNILQNWISNGYSKDLAYYLPQLIRLLETRGERDIIESMLRKEKPTGTVKVRVEELIDSMKEIRLKLMSCRGKKFDANVVAETCGLTASLGSYGLTNTPALDLNQFPPLLPVKPNSVQEAWADSLPRDNVWYYSHFKVSGVFWCGQYDLWGPESMVPASILAPNSSYFIFPRSGHDYYLSEPYLFTRKLLEAVDTFRGVKKDSIDRSLWPLWTGLYENSMFGECKVVIEGKDLVAYLVGSRVVLEPISSNEFIMHGGPGSGGKVTMIVESDGTCNTFIGKGLTFKRVLKEKKNK